MNYNHIDLSKEKNLIPNLYRDGIVKVSNLFDQNFIEEIIFAKERIFSIFPYGQNNNYEKISDESSKTGNYPIKNLLELDPIFGKLLENTNIKYIAEEILGKNFYFTDVNMRIVPKTNHILETHRDQCGGLSFSLLLDNISIDEGETFFFKDSYKNPPSPFVNLNNFSSNVISTTGEIGDVYFWFPDSWHGRNHNLSDKNTCILMVDIENKNTNRKINKIYKNDLIYNSNFLNKIFKLIGNKPNNLLTHFLYCLFRFKIFKKKIEEQKIIYTRLVLKSNFGENFSVINYFKMISFKKFFKNSIFQIIQLIIGRNLSAKLKKIIK